MTSDGSFYMTLPSNTNRQTNRPGNFTVDLPERLYMNQYWKVALVNLIYANAYNQDEGAYLVYAEMGNPGWTCLFWALSSTKNKTPLDQWTHFPDHSR